MDVCDGRVVSNFIVQALRNQDITVYGDGSQTRSFCYVSDLIDGLISFMNASDEITGPMNLGNSREFTISALAREVIKQTNSQSEITYLPLPSDDPLQRKPDINQARKKLGWEPKFFLEEGLKPTINHFRTIA